MKIWLIHFLGGYSQAEYAALEGIASRQNTELSELQTKYNGSKEELVNISAELSKAKEDLEQAKKEAQKFTIAIVGGKVWIE